MFTRIPLTNCLGRPLVTATVALLSAAFLSAAPPQCIATVTKQVGPGKQYATISAAISSITQSDLSQGVNVDVDGGHTYPEKVNVFNKDGSATHRLVIRSVNGTATVDGSDAYQETWYQGFYNPSVWYSYKNGVTEIDPPSSQLFVNNFRFKYVPHSDDFESLNEGEWTADLGGQDTVIYVHAGTSDPNSFTFALGDRLRTAGFDVNNSDYVTIDGFTVKRSANQGINITGTGSSAIYRLNIFDVAVTNCVSQDNYKQGIRVRNCVDCTIDNNTVHDNGGHGILLTIDSMCVVTHNVSYANNDPYVDGIAGDVAGFKIGDISNPDSLHVRNTVVDYNTAYNNEDSGFNIKGTRATVVRRNVSYGNGDHGFDTLVSDDTGFLNNVSARNDHDGLSIESNANNVKVFNCILWHNGLDGPTLNPGSDPRVRELYVANTSGLSLDNNVICGLKPDTISTYKRYLVEFPGGATQAYSSWARYRHNQSSYDTHSYWSDPALADSASAAFWPVDSTSVAVDRGKSDLTGWVSPYWLSADRRGWEPHDIPDPCCGSGSPAYGDIGAYEYDGPPGRVGDLRYDVVSSTSVHLLWTTTGDDGATGPTNASNDVRYNPWELVTDGNWGSVSQASGEPAPTAYGNTQGFTVTGLGPCVWYYFGLKVVDGHGFVSTLSDSTRAYTPPMLYNGQWVCDEGSRAGEMSRARSAGWSRAGERRTSLSVQSSTVSGRPLLAEIDPDGATLGVKLVALETEDTHAYQSGGSGRVLYQVREGDAWETRLRYDLPEGDHWALVAPAQSARWVFLDSLLTEGILTRLVANGTRWNVAHVQHSRLGDLTSSVTGGDAPEMQSGDTLRIEYTGEPADSASLPNALLAFYKPSAPATPTRAAFERSALPISFALHQNHPNPFATATEFQIDLPAAATVRVEVFDLLGRRVAILRNAWMPAGRYTLAWGGRDRDGAVVRPGAYVCRMTAGQFRAQRKVVRLP